MERVLFSVLSGRVLLCVGLLLLSTFVRADQITLVDGTTFVRATGKPVTESVGFSGSTVPGNFVLQIYNGGLTHDLDKVSSAVITLNGETLFSERDFNQQQDYLEKAVSLLDANSLDVLIKSKPGSTLVINIVGEIENRLPVITSQPIAQTDEDALYQYQVVAQDADLLNTLSYELLESPANMIVDAQSGLISWTPVQADVGNHPISVQVSDPEGGTASQSFELLVRNVNDSPVIFSSPELSVLEDTQFLYQAQASDEDQGEQLSWQLVQAPQNVVIDPVTGLVSWTPENADVGEHDFIIAVSDIAGATDLQRFQLLVENVNDTPVITSNPVVEALEDAAYSYQLTAVDIDIADSLSFALQQAPAGMQIDPQSGLLSWLPGNEHVGEQSVSIVVSDLFGATAIQTYSLNVINVNDAPEFTSTPIREALEDSSYQYVVSVTDVDRNDELTLTLLQGPGSMILDPTTNTLSWLPLQADVGNNDVVLQVTDLSGASALQQFTLSVTNVNDAPVVAAVAEQSVNATESLNLTIEAIDEDGDDLTFSLLNTPAGVQINSSTGQLSWTPEADQEGDYQITVEVSDGFVQVPVDIAVTVNPPPFSAPIFTDVSDIVRNTGQSLDYPIAVQSEAEYQLEIVSGPTGLQIDANSGNLIWASVLEGVAQVTLRASITESVFSEQSFNIIGLNVESGHAGQDFWFAFGQNVSNSPRKLYVYISSEVDTQGNIAVPASDFSEDFSVSAGVVTIIEVPNEYMMDSRSDNIQNKGIHLVADDPVTVYGLNHRPFTADGLLFYPTESLGNRYRLMTALGGQAHFVALHDNTEIRIEVAQRVNRLNGAEGTIMMPGDAETVTLNRGQTYGIRANDRSGGSLAGSLVTSNYPVATFSGNYCKNIPEQSGACDVLEEQVLPEHVLGQEYVVVPYGFRFSGDITRVVAAFDNTQIVLNGEYIATIDAGEYLEDDLNEITRITTSQPVAVGQFAKGARANISGIGNLGDPFLINLTPQTMGLDRYQFTIPENYVDLNAVNVVISSDYAQSLKLNNQTVDISQFSAVPNSGLLAGTLELGLGEQLLEADGIFTISVYGFAEFESYGYLGGSSLPRISPSDRLLLHTDLTTLAVGATFCTTIEYQNQVGTPTANVRVDVTTQNAAEPVYHYVTDNNGRAEHCHVGLSAGTENLLVSAAMSTAEHAIAWQYQDADSNRKPVWAMQDYVYAQQDVELRLPLHVVDPDENDVLSFALQNGPAGMFIDELSDAPALVWTATDSQLGEHIVTLVASDSAGDSSLWTFTVKASVGNRPPVFIQAPEDVTIFTGFFYEHPVETFDPDGDTIFCRSEGTEDFGLYVSRENVPSLCNTALMTLPSESDVGIHQQTFYIWDRRGGETSHTYNVEILEYFEPQILQYPDSFAKIGTPYQTQLLVESPVGLPIRYLPGSGRLRGPITKFLQARDMSFNSETGEFSIPLDDSLIGTWDITLRYTDGLRTYSVVFPLTISSDSQPFSVRLDIAPEFPQPGEEVVLTPVVAGAAGSVDIVLTIDGEAVQAQSDGSYRIINTNESGTYNLYLEATDSLGQSYIYNDFFSVADGNDTTSPEASIDNIEDQQLIIAPTDIRVTATDENLSRWRIYFTSVSDSANPVQIAEGYGVLNNEFAHQIDPTMLANGLYRLQLDVYDTSGNRSTDALVVQLDGNLKVGNYTYSVDEFTVPLAGIPINVTRTYDSRRKNEVGDFGYGWFLDYNLIKTEKSRRLGAAWQLNEYTTGPLGALKDFCVESTGDISVNITLPNDEVERFKVKASPECNLTPVLDVKLEFEPQGDTQSTLILKNDVTVRLIDGHLKFLGNEDIFDAEDVILTTREGYDYHFSFDGDVSLIEDPNGNTITFSPTAIEHSSGKRIAISRSDDRVTAIRAPESRTFGYQYDARNNLITATQPSSVREDYTYDYRHGLIDIIDSLGRTKVKNIYDDAGRLIAQEDTDGNRTDFNHDIEGRQSAVTDRNGFITFLYYDDRGNVTRKVDPLGHITTYTYDANDNQLTETDALGNVTTRTYDANNDMLSMTDAEGNVITYSYNARGQETSIVDQRGNSFVNQYDSVGNLLTVTDPDGNLAGNNINEQGLVTLTQNSLGDTTTWQYDDEGNAIVETDPEGAVTTNEWNGANFKTKSTLTRTNRQGDIISDNQTWFYDRNNRITTHNDSIGLVESLTYDTLGNITRRSNGLPTENYEYDVYNRLIRTNYADGTFSSSTYDPEGNKLTDRDRRGNITSYEYDGLNRLIRTEFPDGSSTSSEYDAAGRMIAETDQNGNRTTHAYDKTGRRTSTTDALGNTRSFEFDASGNLVKETDALGRITQYAYDKLDRRTSVTYADNTTTADSYDAMGRQTEVTDQAGISTQYEYDGNGRLTKVTDALGQVTSYTYDQAGNKTSQTDAEGRVTYWEYDARGRVTARELPGGQRETFTYDTGNRLTRHTNFNGIELRYGYNSVTGYLSSIVGGDVREIYRHDANGNRTQVENHSGVYTYQYDSLNRLTEETQPNGSVLQYGYDSAGNKTSLTVNHANGDIRTETYAYDKLNRLLSVTDNQGLTTSYSYDAVGNMTHIHYANELVAEYAFDDLNRVTGITTKDANDNILSQYTYGLDVTGRRQNLTELGGRTSTWTYDSLYRLTQENIVDPVNGNLLTDYVYNATGNRTSQTQNGATTNYVYDSNDRLLSEGSNTYTYDNQGNMLSQFDGVNTQTYSYNAENKLIQFNSGSGNIFFEYNADGIRVNKTQNSQTTDFVVDSNLQYAQVIAEQDNADAINKAYVYGHDLVGQDITGESYFYHYDSLGTTRELSNSHGIISDSYGYDAFGEVQFQSGSTDNNYLYTGEQFDADLDNYYLRARYYDQGVGRFTQMDTWSGNSHDPITLNKYTYGYSDAVNVIDPSGHIGLIQTSIATELRGKMMLASTVGAGGALTIFHSAFSNSGAKGTTSDVQRGILTLLALSGNTILWDHVFQDNGEGNTLKRVEEVLQQQVDDLRQRDPSVTIAVPTPPRKKGWFTCIARAQDLGRSTGGAARYGWGWGISKDFQSAKKAAIRMANSSIGAVDTHHTQWRCTGPKGGPPLTP